MLKTKTNFLVLAFMLAISVSACDSASEKKVEETTVKKDTVVNTIDTTAVPRPREPAQ